MNIYLYSVVGYGEIFHAIIIQNPTPKVNLYVNGKPHTWSKKVPPFQAASINYSNVFNLQYSGIFSDHGSKSSM